MFHTRDNQKGKSSETDKNPNNTKNLDNNPTSSSSEAFQSQSNLIYTPISTASVPSPLKQIDPQFVTTRKSENSSTQKQKKYDTKTLKEKTRYSQQKQSKQNIKTTIRAQKTASW